MNCVPGSEFEAFDRDAARNAGYVYTTNNRLSSQLANGRLTDAALEVMDFRGKRVIDIGCGDGTYTVELYDRATPASIYAVDPAQSAIDVARAKVADRRITCSVESAYDLQSEDNSFDVAHLRGVLHHMDRPLDALRECFRVARAVVFVEPNGYNPVLKVIERVSTYHRQHGEKSYPPARLNRWIGELGGVITKRTWAGLVPMFCPDWFARAMKVLEPGVERVPLVKQLGCAVYVAAAVRRG